MKYSKVLLATILLILILSGCQNSGGRKDVVVTGDQADEMTENLFDVDNDICKEFTPDFVYSAANKPVVRMEPPQDSGGFGCKYYFEYRDDFYTLRDKKEPGGSYVSITLDNIPVARHRENMETIGLKVETDPRITVNHWVARKDDKSIWEVGIPLSQSRFLWISQMNKALTDNEMVDFGARVAEKISGKLSIQVQANPGIKEEGAKEVVPEASHKDVVRNFFQFIADHKVSDALKMMDRNPNALKTWEENLSSINSLKIISVEPVYQDEWNEIRVMYKAVLEVKTDNEKFGWINGQNTRWVTLEKRGSGWIVYIIQSSL